MRKLNLWMMAAILTLCGLTPVLTSCSDSNDGPKATPISAEQLSKMWYAETTVNYTFDDGRQEQLKQVTALDFSADGTGREYSFYVGADNQLRDDADGVMGIEFTYTNSDGVIRTTRKDILNDASADLVREFRYQDGKLTMSNAALSLSPATDAQKAQLVAWLPDGANGIGYNPNDILGPNGFNSSYWREKQHIILYTGNNNNTAQGLYGYTEVPLPWNRSDAQINFPTDFCDDITPENGWQLVMNRCGLNEIANENFFGLYNKYLGILRIFYYMPSKCGNGNDHHWRVLLKGDMAYRSPMIYSIPQDVNIKKPEVFGLDGVTKKDDLPLFIIPWTQNDIIAGSIVPRQGWWAFDLNLSTYRPDLDISDHWLEMRVDEFTKSNVTLFSTLQGSIDGTLKGDIDLKAQYEKGNKACQVCGTVFKCLKGLADIGASVGSFYTKNPGDGIAHIGDVLGTIGDICSEYGQDKLTGFNGTMNATLNLALTANMSTTGSISGATPVDEIVQPTMNIGENFKLKGTGLGKGVWSLKSSPKVYMTNVLTDTGMNSLYGMKSPYGCLWFFDPSSVEVDLNPEVFGDDVEWMRVDAVCLTRKSDDWATIDKYRSALGLKSRDTYQNSYTESSLTRKVTLSTYQDWEAYGNFYYRQRIEGNMPQGITFADYIFDKSNTIGMWGAGKVNSYILPNPFEPITQAVFLFEPMMAVNDVNKSGIVPPVVVDVVVTVKLKSNGKTFVYSGEYLPEIEYLPFQWKADEWVALWNRVKTGPAYYQKYPDQNPTYELHKQRMQDKMKLIYPDAIY